jgi:putative DNA primase/helicase
MESLVDKISFGRWHEILPHFGVSPRFLINKHGPCPICGGKDRFRFDNKENRGTFYCNHCGAGNGFVLVHMVTGLPYNEIFDRVKKMSFVSERRQAPKENAVSNEERAEKIKRLWNSAVEPVRDGPVQKYLTSRLGFYEKTRAIRESLDFFEPTTATRMPAMVSAVADVNGYCRTLHITYLTKDGNKADVTPSKRVLHGLMPVGASIRLFPTAEHIGVCEGIETALAANYLFDVPVWACLNATMLGKFVPPETVKRVTIFADNDETFAGQHAAYSLANRLAVRHKLNVNVEVPYATGQDWADFLRERSGE